MDLSDEVTRLLSDGLDRGAHIQMDLSVSAYPRKLKKLYSDARCHILGVTTVKQSQDGTLLSDIYSDVRCHSPCVAMDKQKNIQEINTIDQLEHSWPIWSFFYESFMMMIVFYASGQKFLLSREGKDNRTIVL